VCEHPHHCEGRRGGGVNTFHVVQWSALHCPAKRRQNPRWRKQFLNVKSSETFTMPRCMHDSGTPFVFYIFYTHIYMHAVCGCALACKGWTKRAGHCSNLSFPQFFFSSSSARPAPCLLLPSGSERADKTVDGHPPVVLWSGSSIRLLKLF
jgi:hypothetical protein